MKKIAFTLFALLVTVAMFAQVQYFDGFEGEEFATMTPTENAKAYADFLKEAYSLDADQYKVVYDLRLKTAEHVQLLDNAVASGETRNGYEEKRNKIIEVGHYKVLNKFTSDQLKEYKLTANKKLEAKHRAQRLGNN